ncbi:polyprenyl synthetase family protein [bacterium]|nr:polyprenyl synthetase family protein [bacterium]
MRTTSVGQNLKRRLAEQRDVVEAALERFLPERDDTFSRLTEAMRYSLFSGGKRLRPILALEAAELLGGSVEAAVVPACAAEFIHTYSLIHDDLPAMDDDEIRRGRPTCHRAFDEALAILAGDGLLTSAFELVAGHEALAPEQRIAVIAELAVANGWNGMVGGQAADIALEGATLDIGAIEYIHVYKTGLPLRAAVRVGAISAGANEKDLALLSSYGESIGLAFQIADDLLDEMGTAEEMGKAVGKDRARGKMTYPAVVGVETARDRARELIDEALSAIEPYGERGWCLAEIARYIIARRS